MHAIFIPYGKRTEVELLLRDMEAQKHLWRMRKDGKEQGIYLQGAVRMLPGGVYEYVFPKEDMDMVLTTLGFQTTNPYNIDKITMAMLKKVLKAEKIPKFKSDKTFLWIRQHVGIIPIGVRYDKDMTDQYGEFIGWEHEAL